MRTILSISMSITALLATTASHAERAITKDKQSLTISCGDDATASVLSNSNKLTFTGKCTAIKVVGNHNQITVASVVSIEFSGNDNTGTIELVDQLDVPGNRNTVSYRGAHDAKTKTKVSSLGTKNKISTVQ